MSPKYSVFPASFETYHEIYQEISVQISPDFLVGNVLPSHNTTTSPVHVVAHKRNGLQIIFVNPYSLYLPLFVMKIQYAFFWRAKIHVIQILQICSGCCAVSEL